MKYIFIVNPTSAKGKAKKIAENIEKVCQEKQMDYVMHYTEAPEDAYKIAKKYQDKEDIIYSVGGDGNVSEVLNGIIGTKNMLGIVPAGSGNDFYRTLEKQKQQIIISK